MTFRCVHPIACLITSGECTQSNFPTTSQTIFDLVSTAIQSDVALIQIREKQLEGRQLFELVSKAAELTRGTATKLLVNDRTDVAIAAGADGVHLPSDSYPPSVAKKIGGVDLIVGVSTHSVEEIRRAAKAGADYVVFGPIFRSPGKTSEKGVGELGRVVEMFPELPILGLGGIDETNVSEVLASGAAGFAAIRYLNEKKNLERLTEVLDKLKDQ